MRWTPGGPSEDLEDRRDEGGGGGGMIGGRGVGLGGLIILGILSFVFKVDLISPFLGGSGSVPTASRPMSPEQRAGQDQQVQFVSFVLDDAQTTWRNKLAESGASYRNAKLVLFRDFVQSACGGAESATGPFYCPGDQKVYIDLSFYAELARRFGAPGEFAQAYVLAHEIGHHVQNVLGIEPKVRRLQRRNPEAGNQLSVKMELQADCFAGVWGHATEQRNILEPGDLEAGLRAAAAVGDDRLQSQTTGRVVPESFTHGSSAQRVEWFKRGFSTGNIAACDTFGQ